jgi:hypothetical protein
MGRMRIKKKAEVIPFPETLAYRMIMLTGSIILFFIFVYEAFARFRAGSSTATIVFVAFTLLTGYLVFYNMDHLKDARVSPEALKRMKRR